MYTDKELLIFAEILKRNCENQMCIDCPFSMPSKYSEEYLDCKICLEPEHWILEEISAGGT